MMRHDIRLPSESNIFWAEHPNATAPAMGVPVFLAMEDRDCLALILQGKRLGYSTLTEIRKMLTRTCARLHKEPADQPHEVC